MRRLVARFSTFSQSNYAVSFMLLLALVLHVGVFWSEFYADDYMQAAYFAGSPVLAERGLLDGIEPANFAFVINNQFNFFDPAVGNDEAMRRYGALPWWMQQGAMLHLYRPLASLSHWLDYQLWPTSVPLMLAQNLLIYLLALWVILKLYLELGERRSVALFALLLIVLDVSCIQTLQWVAARNMLLCWLFAALCLLAYHRGVANVRWYAISLLSLLAALLSAEGGVAVGGFLAAYMLVVDRRSWAHRILGILPFAVLTIVWRLVYQQAGFGSLNIDQYIDPGRDPLAFTLHAVQYFPFLFFELFSGIDSIEGFFANHVLAMLSVIACLGMLLFLVLIFVLARRVPKTTFWFLGAMFSLVPGLALFSTDSRVLMIPAIGAAVIMAQLVRVVFCAAQQTFPNGMLRLLARATGIYILLVHVVLSALVLLANNRFQIAVDTGMDDYDSMYDVRHIAEADKHLMLLNPPNPFKLMYLPYHAAYIGAPVPQTIRTLLPGLSEIELLRTHEKRFELKVAQGAFFDGSGNIPGSETHATGEVYAGQKLLGFFHDGDYRLRVGQQFHFREVSITVEQLIDERPSVIVVTLAENLSPDAFQWVWWDWHDKKFKRLVLPAVGDLVKLPGPFES